jgi:uncharacterized membrane-anchored protein YjiN (DUF445 family)
VAAAVLAIAAFPSRATWWGGWILAMAEAGVVGGLADWFAVTAIFRRPLGLPIPHTALIPANWELMASRVGAMVGGRVLTKEYVTREIAEVDVADLLARGAERVTRADLEALTRIVADWAVAQFSPATASELLARGRRLLVARPLAPTLAAALDVAREHGWDERIITALVSVLAEAMDRSEFRQAVGDVVDDLLVRYQERMGPSLRMWIGLARLFGLIDRDRLVAALHEGLGRVAADPDHPLRARLAELVRQLPDRLRTDSGLAARVEAAKAELLETPVVTRLLDDVAAALHRALREDLERPRSELVSWIGDRLEAARKALASDAALRADLDRWLKTRVIELVERYHGRVAGFIENGVRALGPEGAVRLIEEHAGDDLQYIRVNGTVVGGLAGAAIYGVHLLLRLL